MRNLKQYPITDDEAIAFMELMLEDYKNTPADAAGIGDPAPHVIEYIIEQLSNYKDLKES